jgi:hypothetical protein
MSTTIRLVNDLEYANVSTGSIAEEQESQPRPSLDDARWSTKQVIAACLWSALIGLGCGYGWLLLQVGGAGCQ